METILQKLNIQISEKSGKSASVLIIKNPDGTPRWICNASVKNPIFLKFYLVSSLRSRLFATLLKIIFALGLQRILFEVHEIRYTLNENGLLFDPNDRNWALFTGTTGPNNKYLMYRETPVGNFYYKIATTSRSKVLIENEVSKTKMLETLNLTSFSFPLIEVVSENFVGFSDVSSKGNRMSQLTDKHKSALKELREKTSVTLVKDVLPVLKQTEEKLSFLESINDDRMPKGIVRKLRLLQKSIADKKVIVSLSHGDFTPWNMYVNDDGISIYDWELSDPLMPVGYDAFHFISQQGILVDRIPWSSIRNEINMQVSAELIGVSNNEWLHYLRLYLLINTVANLYLFAKQESWHLQVNWLIDTWNDAISDSLSSLHSSRELVIIDIFDLLYNKDYSSVKFPKSSPESLSEFSDIDLLVGKSNAKQLLKSLQHHPLVDHIKSSNKSFMNSSLLFLNDGSVLSIDFIWKFKRRSLELLNLNRVIFRSSADSFGVRHVKDVDLARYIGLFYGLNNAKVPAKYEDKMKCLSGEIDQMDEIIYSAYLKQDTSKLKYALLKRSFNKGLNRINNVVMYCIDTLRTFLSFNGLIITFSGVDGAGKSTIIDNLKLEIEKKIRRRVVVLRHRPSILPILSAWTKGKEQAEKDAAETLPRQGKNSNPVSSLIRFVYYYVDYLFGQFYIMMKHTVRGDIVLYDRYYFDFINDSKRSNINIPQSVANFGYRALLKPHLNFFLYADANVILMRKQELDKSTIIDLTNSYLKLFENLNKSSVERYISIKNNDLRSTLDIILNKTIAKVA